MGQNLTGQTIASTYEDLVQISGSILTDGTGSDITNISITASNAVSASYAFTASFALNAGTTVDTGSLLVTASISDATTTYTKGDGSTFALTTNNVQNATSASFATTASYAETANLGTAASASFTGSTWTFNHNLGKEYVIIDCYDNNNEEIIPSTIDLVSTNQASITFPVSVQGVAVASLGNGTSQNQVTQSFNTYNSFSPANAISLAQGSAFNVSTYTQKLTITSTGTYNLHVSAAGGHWVDCEGLASGVGCNVNVYIWPDQFTTANSGAAVLFSAGPGSGTYATIRTIVTASVSTEYYSAGATLGVANSTIARNATLTRRDCPSSTVNPTGIFKAPDGTVYLTVSTPGVSIPQQSYRYTGNQGTPL